jgi:hypothetical protein
MQGKRRWLGRRVWVIDGDGKRHYGTAWWIDETTVLIREEGRTGLVALPKSEEGTRWGFMDGNDKK